MDLAIFLFNEGHDLIVSGASKTAELSIFATQKVIELSVFTFETIIEFGLLTGQQFSSLLEDFNSFYTAVF